MQFGDLKGVPVVDVEGAERLGRVDDALLDLEKGALVGLRVDRTGLFSGHAVLPWTDIKAIGVDAVTVQSENVLQNEKDAAGAEDSTRASSLLGARVMTENGKELGTVHDVDLDMAAGRITGFTLPGNLLDRLQHHPHLVPITGVRSVGDGLIVVANEVAHALT